MDVSEFFDQNVFIGSVGVQAPIEMTGWLVIIDAELVVLEEDYTERYVNSRKVKVSNRDVVYAIRDCIYPLGGGDSFIFHRCRIVGRFLDLALPVIELDALYVYEKPKGFILVDLDPEKIGLCKTKYGDHLLGEKKEPFGDWLDYLK